MTQTRTHNTCAHNSASLRSVSPMSMSPDESFQVFRSTVPPFPVRSSRQPSRPPISRGCDGPARGNRCMPAGAASFDCVVDPSLTLKLGSPVPGLLDEVEVERGDRVTKGQVVARLESAVERETVALNEAKARSSAEIVGKEAIVEQKRGVYTRKKSLQANNYASVSGYRDRPRRVRGRRAGPDGGEGQSAPRRAGAAALEGAARAARDPQPDRRDRHQAGHWDQANMSTRRATSSPWRGSIR